MARTFSMGGMVATTPVGSQPLLSAFSSARTVTEGPSPRVTAV